MLINQTLIKNMVGALPMVRRQWLESSSPAQLHRIVEVCVLVGTELIQEGKADDAAFVEDLRFEASLHETKKRHPDAVSITSG